MKRIFALTFAAVVALAIFAPSPAKAGPFIYRGGPWDRWVSPVLSTVTGDYWNSGYYYPGYASSYYYPSTSYYYPSTSYYYPSTSSYYYPDTSYYSPSTTYYYPWTSSYYYTTPTYYYGRRGWRWR
jgi:hypothetical protein